jgi:hypothetical protein
MSLGQRSAAQLPSLQYETFDIAMEFHDSVRVEPEIELDDGF